MAASTVDPTAFAVSETTKEKKNVFALQRIDRTEETKHSIQGTSHSAAGAEAISSLPP